MTTETTTASTQREPELLGQTVVLIGGSGGIGLETARRARTEGAEVVLTGRDPERLERAALDVGARTTAAFDATDAAALKRGARTIATGVIGLTIGMGMWWNYFDLLGRRVPGQHGGRLATWLYAHLPLTMAIAASGAAMVSLVDHAADSRTPATTAWLLTGSVAVMLASVTLAVKALPDDAFPPGMTRRIAPTFGLAAAATLVLGAARPSPIVLVIGVALIEFLTWLRLFALYLALGGVPDVSAQREPEA